jgi:2-C-methyl-D-erythritol 4-phosphate cytidylyltransferase
MNSKEYALVVAGGKGTRIKSSTPKQFLPLNGLPILMHTLEAFHRYSENITLILVLPETDIERWNALCRQYNFSRKFILQIGGETRFQSVKRGLEKIEGDGLVAIHDGVRPLVSTDLIASSFRLAEIHHSAIAAVPLKESIRIIGEDSASQAVDRSKFRLIQTPQTFRVSMIKKAYEATEDSSLTDDASVAERTGHRISLYEGNYENIKITTAEDLTIAEALLKSRKV